jgi:hypothetical protein
MSTKPGPQASQQALNSIPVAVWLIWDIDGVADVIVRHPATAPATSVGS